MPDLISETRRQSHIRIGLWLMGLSWEKRVGWGGDDKFRPVYFAFCSQEQDVIAFLLNEAVLDVFFSL